MEDPRIQFGHHVRQVRQAKGWSQEDLAERCNLDRTYIGGIERGERNISIVNIAKIAHALDLSLSEIMDFSNNG